MFKKYSVIWLNYLKQNVLFFLIFDIMSDCSRRFNLFCYACGKYTIMPSKRKITPHIADLYEKYFNMRIIENVTWAPSIVCSTCYVQLHEWSIGKRDHMPYGTPMIWIDPGTHSSENCYVCKNNVYGHTKTSRINFKYTSVLSAQTPLPHTEINPPPRCPIEGGSSLEIPEATTSSEVVSMYEPEPSELTPTCTHIPITQPR